jgi:excinuclease ABC subunit A
VDQIVIRGAREHNLKNIDLTLPRNALVVVSGLSGSGKSSLAFDTIFAEGQRRYVESLSAYARQFLGRLDKPDVDYIEGLSPAVAIEQKSAHRNPRSTVGTVTEIYDYLRLLYARVGVPHCPSCGKVIREHTADQIVEHVLGYPEDARVTILAPLVKLRKGKHEKLLEDARRAGFVRVRVDGEVRSLDEELVLDKNKRHTMELVVDRLKVRPEIRRRLSESVEAALSAAQGQLVVSREGAGEEHFSQSHGCPDCGTTIPPLEPQLFSFNSPAGACPACSGLGVTMEFDPALLIPDPDLSFEEGGIAPFNPKANWYRSVFTSLASHYGFSLTAPLKDLPKEVMQVLLHGTDDKVKFRYTSKDRRGKWEYSSGYRGILKDLKRRYQETTSEGVRQWLEEFMSQRECPECRGKRLRPESLAVTVGGRSIHEASSLSIDEADRFFRSLALDETERTIAKQVLKAVQDRLGFMMSVGLDYLTLDRKAASLSGGEAQRIRLATQIGSSLVGVLYILDEPTIGLHQRDNARLIETLLRLRDMGNTLVVVEHDEQTLRAADFIVDLGPGAGVHGGEVVASGTCAEVMANPRSLTGRYLAGTSTITPPAQRRLAAAGKLVTIRGAREHNLKGIDVDFPLGCLSAITGVSGSGKSTLLNDILLPAVANRLGRARAPEGDHDGIEGWDAIDKVIDIDQSPIGRTPRSNPATYVGLFGPIRELFAGVPEAKARGYSAGRFSFNVKGGRCEHCDGDGVIRIEMQFLPDVYITCDHCKGKRYNGQTLEVRYKGKSIYEVLELTVEEALDVFRPIPALAAKLETLRAVGLGYLTLGQSALTLSGGEAQRVKLSLELSRRSTGRTLYILDEPTTGLHFEDVRKLVEVLQLLVEAGNTVVLIEHNIDVIMQADYVVDLGPEGGARGGELVAAGTPEELMGIAASHTGRYLAEAATRRERA